MLLRLPESTGHAGPAECTGAPVHTTGCRVSEAMTLTSERVDLASRAVVFETLKKRRRGVFRAVPVPAGRLDQLDLVHGLREAQRRGKGHADLVAGPGIKGLAARAGWSAPPAACSTPRAAACR